MARRLLAIPLAVTIVIAVFLFPVLGTVPDSNNVTVQFQIWEYLTLYGREEPFLLYDNTTGNTFCYGVRGYDRDENSNTLIVPMDKQYNAVTISLSGTATVWIAVRTAALSSYDFSYLSTYRNSSGDLTHTFTNKVYPRYSCWWESGEIISDGNMIENFNVTYLCFKDVPASNFSYIDRSIGTDSGNYIYRVSGVYINRSSSGTVGDILIDYQSGGLSFSDALSSIRDITATNVSASSSADEKLFHVLNAQYTLDQLLIASDDRALQQLHDSFIPSLDSQISAYQSGDQTLVTTLTNMSSSYSSALASAETAEQGSMITSAYSFKVQHFRLIAEQMAADRLESAISDEEMQQASDYYASESELLSQFDFQAFKDTLSFDMWYQRLDLVEAASYKSIFDYIINDSPVRDFIVIPLTLIIVSVLLGTHIKIPRSRGDE